MSELDKSLRGLVDGATTPVTLDEVRGRVEGVAAPVTLQEAPGSLGSTSNSNSNARLRWLVAAAALVVVALFGALVLTLADGNSRVDMAGTGQDGVGPAGDGGAQGEAGNVGVWEEMPDLSPPQGTISAATDGSRVAAVLTDEPGGVPELWVWERPAGWTRIDSAEPAGLAAGTEPLVVVDHEGPVYLVGTTRPLCEIEPPVASEGFVIEGDTWRPLPPAPQSLGCMTHVVDVGDSLVAASDAFSDVLRFDKSEQTWSTFEWPQSEPESSAPDRDVADAVGPAPIVVPVFASGALPTGDPPLAVLDLRSLEWLSLPALPAGFDDDQFHHPVRFVAAQDAIIAWNGRELATLRDEGWTTPEVAPRPSTDGSAIAAFGSRVVLWGGFAPQGGFDQGQQPTDDGVIYDVATENWSTLIPSPLHSAGWPIVLPLSESELWVAAGPIVGDDTSESRTPWAILELP